MSTRRVRLYQVVVELLCQLLLFAVLCLLLFSGSLRIDVMARGEMLRNTEWRAATVGENGRSSNTSRVEQQSVREWYVSRRG